MIGVDLVANCLNIVNELGIGVEEVVEEQRAASVRLKMIGSSMCRHLIKGSWDLRSLWVVGTRSVRISKFNFIFLGNEVLSKVFFVCICRFAKDCGHRTTKFKYKKKHTFCLATFI